MDRRFEWDLAKAAANLRDHDYTFEEAAIAWKDPFAVEAIDERESYGEERINLLGVYAATVLHVTYTVRGEKIRIISARKATKHEREDYYSKNAHGWSGG
jgi:uncharacterized DUF497 family protein